MANCGKWLTTFLSYYFYWQFYFQIFNFEATLDKEELAHASLKSGDAGSNGASDPSAKPTDKVETSNSDIRTIDNSNL